MNIRQDKINEHQAAVTIAASNFALTAEQVRWHYIHLVHENYGRNTSETARQLGMHRRTLQRVLAKSMPKRKLLVSA